MIAFRGVRSSWISWRSESAGKLGAEHARGPVADRGRSRRAAAGARCRDSRGSCRAAARKRARRKSASRRRPGRAGDAEAGVAERRALLERARRLAVDAMMARPGDRGDALRRPAARAARLRPSRMMPSVPVSQRKPSACSAGANGAAGGAPRARAEGLDPRDQLADLRIRSARPAPPASGRRFGRRAFAEHEIARAEGAERVLDLADRDPRDGAAKRARPGRGAAAERARPRRSSSAWAISGAAIEALSSAKKASRSGATARPASARAAWRRIGGIDVAARLAQAAQKARSRSVASSPSGRRWASRSTSWRHCARPPVGPVGGPASTVAIMSSKRMRPQA